MRSSITVLALAGAILVASAGEASAQRGGRGERGGRGGSREGNYGNNYYGGGYGGYGGYGGFGYAPYYQYSGLMYGNGYPQTYITPEPYSYNTQSFYNTAQSSPMPQAAYVMRQTIVQQPTAQQAFIAVSVPTADTELWFGKTQVAQQPGTFRLIYSPDLETGKSYTYKVTARWMVDGKPVEKVHEVEIRAGQTSMTDFHNGS